MLRARSEGHERSLSTGTKPGWGQNLEFRRSERMQRSGARGLEEWD